ncbi:hypothetical protein PRZ48_009625 [Zasmidium cellare]|uniref:Uncharacterized protein n=1 Tax=Zasmidium cellare TaxID=395010 RepID=A0ABR0ED33_ZASCE|nr:hypothetical protein PRZ48_009625 [Zasmidium cellare]
MKTSTTFALAALLGSSVVFAAPWEKPLDYEKQVMLDNYYRIPKDKGTCLEWKAVKNPNDWVQDSVKGGKRYWPSMQPECVSWQMRQGERSMEYLVYLAAGSPETCRDWQVKVDNNYVSPVCMADIPREDREDPAFDLNDELPLNITYGQPHEDLPEDTEQPSMQIIGTAYQVGAPFKECAAWKVVQSGYDPAEFEPGIAPECWKWKDSEHKVNNYTLVTGKYKIYCQDPKGYVVRLDGHTAYAQCASTPDVGFNQSVTTDPTPWRKNPVIDDTETNVEKRQAQPSTPGVTFIDQEWVSHSEFGHRADFHCTEWVVSHAEGHPDVLLPVCHHWNEGEPGQTFPYLVVTGQTHGECKAGWAVKADGPDVYPYCPSPDGDKKKDTPGPAPAKDPKDSKEPSISYVNEEDVPTEGHMACSAWRLDFHSGTRKVIVPKCAQIKAAQDTPEYYTVVTALVTGDCHTRWEAHATANRVYAVCAPPGKRPINTANPDQDICDRAPTMVDIEVVSLNEHDRNIAASCGADPRLVNAAEKQHQKEAQEEAEHWGSEETEEIEERDLHEDSEFQDFCERVAKKGDEEVRALTPDELKTALLCKTGLKLVVETVFNATKAQGHEKIDERDIQEDSEFQEFCEHVAKKGDEEVRALTPDEQKTALLCETGFELAMESLRNATKPHEQ